MATTVSIPKDQNAFKEETQALLAQLEGRNPSEITEEVVARHILDVSKDKAVVNTQRSSATFSPNRTLTIKPELGKGVVFNGTCDSQYSSLYMGSTRR